MYNTNMIQFVQLNYSWFQMFCSHYFTHYATCLLSCCFVCYITWVILLKCYSSSGRDPLNKFDATNTATNYAFFTLVQSVTCTAVCDLHSLWLAQQFVTCTTNEAFNNSIYLINWPLLRTLIIIRVYYKAASFQSKQHSKFIISRFLKCYSKAKHRATAY